MRRRAYMDGPWPEPEPGVCDQPYARMIYCGLCELCGGAMSPNSSHASTGAASCATCGSHHHHQGPGFLPENPDLRPYVWDL